MKALRVPPLGILPTVDTAPVGTTYSTDADGGVLGIAEATYQVPMPADVGADGGVTITARILHQSTTRHYWRRPTAQMTRGRHLPPSTAPWEWHPHRDDQRGSHGAARSRCRHRWLWLHLDRRQGDLGRAHGHQPACSRLSKAKPIRNALVPSRAEVSGRAVTHSEASVKKGMAPGPAPL
jgi:hypothetical protein